MHRILFVVSEIYGWGGIEKVVTSVANELSKNGEVCILSFFDSLKRVEKLNTNIKVRILETETKSCLRLKLFKTLKQAKIISELIRNEQIDVVITTRPIINMYMHLIKKTKKTKWISWNHTEYIKSTKLFLKYLNYVERKYADALVFLSDDDLKNYLSDGKANGICKCIPNPSSFSSVVKENKEKIAFAAGRLNKNKQFDKLIESWARLEEKFPEWQLIIAGDGEERENLQNRIADLQLKNVSLVGYTSRIEEYYKNAAIFCCTSKSEGFPIVMADALAFGIPIISFECGGGVKSIIENGINGFLVEQGNAKEFAERMEMLMTNAEVLCKFAIQSENTSKKYAIENIIAEWEKLITN